jgi:phosphoadenosine phosphosulfate reductase
MKDLANYLLYAKLRCFNSTVEYSKRIIRDALAQSMKPYVACSWGKDSLCLLHLVCNERPGIDAIWVTTDEFDEWPGTYDVAQSFCDRHDVNLSTVATMPVTECYRRTGGFYVFAETEDQRRADRDYNRSFIEAITNKADEMGCNLAFIGLRQEESKGRRIMLRKHGSLFYAKSRDVMECFPLSRWTGKDVWAYIALNELPYPELYDYAEDRERARNGAMFAANVPTYGGESHYNGQLAALKQVYPDLFNHFAAEFPEVRCYV